MSLSARPFKPGDRVIHDALGHGTVSEIADRAWFADVWKVKVQFDRLKGLDIDLTSAEIAAAPRLKPFTVISGASCLPRTSSTGIPCPVAAPAPGRSHQRPGNHPPNDAA